MAKLLCRIRMSCLIWINRSVIVSGFIQFKQDGKLSDEPMERWQTDIPQNLRSDDDV